MFSRVDTMTFPIYGNTMLRYEQQTFTALFCTLKSDFMDVKRFNLILVLCLPRQLHVIGALGRSCRLKSAFLDSKRL